MPDSSPILSRQVSPICTISSITVCFGWNDTLIDIELSFLESECDRISSSSEGYLIERGGCSRYNLTVFEEVFGWERGVDL
jgi:hypothetical protein